ncbi:MAG: DUF805 domain-containing protein [Opitutales bacterium]|nr:DUF805 domain-containing protein [Opitutales bacterium]
MPKVNTAPIILSSVARFFAILTFGVFGGAQGAFSPRGEIGRAEFWRGYLLPALYLFLAGAGAYRILFYYCGNVPQVYSARRILFALALFPAVFTLFVGEMKRLRHVGVWGVLAAANFCVPWGALAVAIVCAAMPKISKAGKNRRAIQKP